MQYLLKIGSAALLSLFAAESYAASDIIVSRPDSVDSKIYLGANVGNAMYDSANDSDIGFGVFGGFRFNQFLGVELGYTDLGKVKKKEIDRSLSAIHASVVGYFEASEAFNLYGKVGLANWDYEVDFGTHSHSESGNDVTYGFGLDYAVGQRASVRFSADFFSANTSDEELNGYSEDVILIGVGIKMNL